MSHLSEFLYLISVFAFGVISLVSSLNAFWDIQQHLKGTIMVKNKRPLSVCKTDVTFGSLAMTGRTALHSAGFHSKQSPKGFHGWHPASIAHLLILNLEIKGDGPQQ